MKTLIVGHDRVSQLLPMQECIEVMEEMFKTLAHGKAILPKRSIIPSINSSGGALGVMPALLGEVLGAKVITLFPGNMNTRYETHQGAVLLFEREKGSLLAMLDAASITAIRTAAVSAVATRALALKDASHLAILGSGTQAGTHLEAMLLSRPIKSIRLWSRNIEHSKRFSKRFQNSFPGICVSDSVSEAVEGADIICTTTASTEPILKAGWVKTGAHINAVGAYTSSSRELDSELVMRSTFYVDTVESALSEAGDFIIPLKEGLIDSSHIRGDLGQVLVGKVHGRKTQEEITLFKSLGLATEDLSAAERIYSKAVSESIGEWFEFTPERELL